MLIYTQKNILFVYWQKTLARIAIGVRKSNSSRTSSGRNCEFILMDFKATFMFRGRDDTEPGFALPWAHPAQHDVFMFARNHELGKDLINSCALAAVMAVTQIGVTGVMQ